MRATIQVTAYSVAGGSLRENTVGVDMEVLLYRVDRADGPQHWLALANGPQSVQITPESEPELRERGWLAQTGTPPVCVDGRWGGRNYPRYEMPASEVCRVLDALSG